MILLLLIDLLRMPVAFVPIPCESVDLMYFDLPEHSNATYNGLFKEERGAQSSAKPRSRSDVKHLTLRVRN